VIVLWAAVVLVLLVAARVFRAGVVNQASAASLRARLFGRKPAQSKPAQT
jgi:hypothetical protein